ncbi:MAG: hypothetical protein MUE58_10365, partial [Chitinophagaceae bacterium]|nr:hypothetical protein [Chitinophagaceae bacterium]
MRKVILGGLLLIAVFALPCSILADDTIAKGDELLNYIDETVGNTGAYILNNFEIYNKQLYFLISGRYDYVYFNQVNRLLGAQND